MPPLNLVRTAGMPIVEQLRIEEGLLRTKSDSWCLINRGSPPTIVMGISGSRDRLVEASATLPIVRRYSGGGTVVVDESTLFVSFICAHEGREFAPYPEPIHRWARDIYADLFGTDFALRENDYVFGERKFGGNAQYIKRDRWVHHSTFLWDYDPSRMSMLRLPEKAPDYRAGRSHDDFLCRLSERFSSLNDLEQSLMGTLSARFRVEERPLPALFPEHRVATTLL